MTYMIYVYVYATYNQCGNLVVDSLRNAKYLFSDLEDMYVGIMKHGQNTEMMISELGDTLSIQK